MWSKAQLLKCRKNIHLAAASLPDNQAAETPELFEAWEVGRAYSAEDRFRIQ